MHLGRPHIGIREQPGAVEALGLEKARGGDALAHRSRGLALALARRLFIIHTRNLDLAKRESVIFTHLDTVLLGGALDPRLNLLGLAGILLHRLR
jgi:hypothetical protein